MYSYRARTDKPHIFRMTVFGHSLWCCVQGDKFAYGVTPYGAFKEFHHRPGAFLDSYYRFPGRKEWVPCSACFEAHARRMGLETDVRFLVY